MEAVVNQDYASVKSFIAKGEDLNAERNFNTTSSLGNNGQTSVSGQVTAMGIALLITVKSGNPNNPILDLLRENGASIGVVSGNNILGVHL
jgi:hypothetical protein